MKKDRSLNLVLLALLSSVILSQLNSSMASMALNTIMDNLNIDVDKVTWVVTIYLLGYTVFMPIYGRLGDMFGHKRMFIIGNVLYAVGSILGFFSRNFFTLVIARLIQSSGSAAFTPMSFAIIANTFPEDRKGQAVGFWGASIGIGSAIGPTLGGVLIDFGGWNAIFLPSAILGPVILIAAVHLLPKVKISADREALDIFGAVFLTISLTGLLLFLTLGKNVGWLNYSMILLLVMHVLALIVFVIWEKRVQNPLVDLGLIFDKNFSSVVLGGFIQMFTQMSSFVLLPLYLLRIAGFSTTIAGVVIFFQSAVTTISSPFAGRMVDNYGIRRPVGIGIISIIIATLGLSMIGGNTSIFYITAVISLFGFGLGFYSSPLAAASTSSISPEKLGSAIGLYNMVRYLGSTFGSTITGIVLKAGSEWYSALGHSHPESKAVASIYMMLAIINVFAFILSRSFGRDKNPEATG